jgi:hypothetical protein
MFWFPLRAGKKKAGAIVAQAFEPAVPPVSKPAVASGASGCSAGFPGFQTATNLSSLGN